MIVDTSALIAILKNELEAEAFSLTIEAAKVVRISAASYFESRIVITRYKDPILMARLEEILENPGLQIEPVTATQAKIAWEAYRDYGKGSGHRAGLNFGDCFTYA
ncbi:MAG TPA: type II toxin-antitoxin system VapC family toxin, partial [Terracidiphilus sp.]